MSKKSLQAILYNDDIRKGLRVPVYDLIFNYINGELILGFRSFHPTPNIIEELGLEFTDSCCGWVSYKTTKNLHHYFNFIDLDIKKIDYE